MIIVRSPLRISIVGGGTDLPSWYPKHGSMFISAAIDKYIYITMHRSKFDKRIRLRYSRMEQVDSIDQIKHGIIRETFRLHNINNDVELTSHAEIPSGTGLGSSGSFGVGILQAICPFEDAKFLAEESTKIQMVNLKYPIGWQDQLAAAYGGVNKYEISRKGDIKISPVDTKHLEDNLVMFYTGIKRGANNIISNSTNKGLDKIQELAYKFTPKNYGEILREHWEFKKKRGAMTTPLIDEMYNLALKNGAIGGKIIGAGGGGMLLFYTNDREKLIKTMPLLHIPFKFSKEGSKVLLNDQDIC